MVERKWSNKQEDGGRCGAEGDCTGFRFEHSKFKMLNRHPRGVWGRGTGWKYMKGVISTWMIVRAMRLNKVTKEVLGKRGEQRTIGSALDSALEQLHFEVRLTRMYQERRQLKLAPFLNLFIFSTPLNINVLLQNK